MLNPLWILSLAIASPVIAGATTLLLPRRAVTERVILAILGPALTVLMLAWYACGPGLDAGPFAVAWMPDFKLNLGLHADHLGLFFALLVGSVGFLIVLYARAYFGPDPDSLYRFYPSLLLFMTAMLGVVLADNLMLLLLFWEMTSISSFLLIGWERDQPGSVRNAMQAFIVTGAGGLALMGGMVLLGLETGCWSFSELSTQVEVLAATPRMTAAFLMIFAGAAAKSAQFPLHFWLPGAMAAPTPVSAYLHSATMVKAGVYLVGRLWPVLAVVLPLWPQLIVPIGAITMVYGAFIALQKEDLKQIFAYTTVSQLGLLVCMYGLSAFQYGGDVGHGAHAAAAEPNLIWDVTQILNHALYKAPLFIMAGAIGHIASRQLPELRGFFFRGTTERVMSVVLILAAYALAAGPLTISFSAKEFFFYQIWHGYEATHNVWFYGLIAAGVATGMFNVAVFVRLARTILARPTEPAHQTDHHDADSHGHDDHHHETGFWAAMLWVPAAVLVSFQFIGGAIPGAYERLFGWLEANANYFDHFPLVWDVHPGAPLYMSLGAIGLGLLLGFAPIMRGVYRDPFDHAYPGFYSLITKGGGRVFRVVQSGHSGEYLALVMVALLWLFAWSTGFDLVGLIQEWPRGAGFELDRWGELLPGIVLAVMVCLTATLMPFVNDRASRVLMLGACGFSVTGVYYLYRAPDLALTQISIEIVSLILFLLVLSVLPDEEPGPRLWVGRRLVLSLAVGVVMFWITLSSSVGDQPGLHHLGREYPHLGTFFLRNSHHGEDAHSAHGVTDAHAVASTDAHGAPLHPETPNHPNAGRVKLERGGGGRNVVNVILVDFRGFDTLGEITVLGLAAMGVWTLLRRRQGFKSPKERVHQATASGSSIENWELSIPDPTGGPDPEDTTLRRMLDRGQEAT